MPGKEALDHFGVMFQFMFWGAVSLNAILVGVSAWFLKRYVDKKDKVDEDVIAKLTDHDKKAMEHTIKIEQISTAMKNVALDFKKDQLDFHRSLNIELLAVRKEVGDTRVAINETRSSAEGISTRLADVRKEMTGLYENVQAHQRQLSMGAQTIHRHDEQIKTILKQLGPNATLVTQEKKPNDPKGGK